MGLLSGSVSLTRWNVVSRPEVPDFEQEAFREIPPGSELREAVGFVPFEPAAPYQVGEHRFAFRVRFDKLQADKAAVEERLKLLIQSEIETTGAAFVGPKKRKKLRQLAEDELIGQAAPRTKIIEGCIDGKVVYLASTSEDRLGRVVSLLRKIGVLAEAKTPWIDRQEPDFESDLVEISGPGQSALGCRFLRELVGDAEILYEPEAGSVKLKTHDTLVSVSGAVLKDVLRYLERGAEILNAKLLTPEGTFRLDGLTFRISGLKIETGRHEHWIEHLDERLEKIATVWDRLDTRYGQLASRLRQKTPVRGV